MSKKISNMDMKQSHLYKYQDSIRYKTKGIALKTKFRKTFYRAKILVCFGHSSERQYILHTSSISTDSENMEKFVPAVV